MNAEPTRTDGSNRSRWWTAAMAFVAGLAIGVVAIGLFPRETSDAPVTRGPAVPPATAGPLPSVGSTTEARVNAACLRVINEAQQVYTIISGVGEATTDVDLRRLDNMVRQLQPLEPLLQRDLQACKVDTTVGSGSPTPTPPQTTGTPVR